jgi:vitamin B12 transporter
MRRARGGMWLFAAGLLATGSSARSARGDPPPQGQSAADVTVQGVRPSSAPGFVSTASEADATREVTDVASLLDPLPGVHVRRTGADDTFSTLSIRGSTSSEVAVLLAGVPLTGAADPSLDLASLPMWPGARVRVFRSFTPASVGSGSLGGTLMVEPPRPTDAEGSLVWLGVGSWGEERMRIADVRAVDDGRGRIVTALSASRATDDFTYFDPTRASSPDPYSTRQNAGYAALNGFAALALPLDLGGGEPGTVTMTTLVQSRLQHLPGSIESPSLFAELRTNRELLSIDVEKPLSDKSVLHLSGWTRRDEIENRDQPPTLTSGGPGDLLVSTDDVIVGAGGAASLRHLIGKRASVEGRVDGSFERFAPGDDVSTFGLEPSATRGSVGGGADAEFRPVPRWDLGASGRLDANVDAADALSPGAGGVPPQEGTDVRPTGHVGTEVQVGPVALSAHGGALSRPPSFVERYGGGAFLANPALASESAVTADVGARYEKKGGKLRARVEVDGFATHAEDLITLVPDGALGRFKAENISSARIYGVEASLDLRGYGFDARAAYTGLLTFDDDPNACVTCTTAPPLPGRPGHDFVGDLAYALGPVRVRYGVDYVGSIYTSENGTVRAPDRLLQSTGVRVVVPWVKTLRLAFDVQNLLDVRTGLAPSSGPPLPGLPAEASRVPIGDQFDYPLPGRSFLFTARWSPGREESH